MACQLDAATLVAKPSRPSWEVGDGPEHIGKMVLSLIRRVPSSHEMFGTRVELNTLVMLLWLSFERPDM